MKEYTIVNSFTDKYTGEGYSRHKVVEFSPERVKEIQNVEKIIGYKLIEETGKNTKEEINNNEEVKETTDETTEIVEEAKEVVENTETTTDEVTESVEDTEVKTDEVTESVETTEEVVEDKKDKKKNK